MSDTAPYAHRLRLGRPVWIQDAPAGTQQYPSQSGDIQASVAIVGGGMTGALVAHAFASAGVSTVLVERGLIGRGSTAASSALLLAEPDLELTDLADRYGRRRSRRIWQMGRDSVRGLIALLRRLEIDCDLKLCDSVYYAAGGVEADRLCSEFERRTAAGFASRWLGAGTLRRMTGLAARGAILTHGSGQFDPYRACVGVLGAAARAGARVFERSEVRRIDAGHDRVRLHTRRGTIACDRVIIATGYATPRFRPLAGRFRMFRTYVVATEPVSARQRRDIGLSDVMVWDAARPYHYARWSPDHRLLLGGGDRLVGPGRPPQLATATAELRAHFETRWPALAAIDTAFAWEGLFAMTPDSLPFIGPHRRYPRHWFALGYGGNGMTFGYLAARLLLERWRGHASRDHALFEFGRSR